MPKPLVHVPCPPHGGGLARDRRILHATLRAHGWDVLDFPWPGHPPDSRRYRLKRLLSPRLWRGMPDVNLFLEQVDPRWLSQARRQWLMPNPEWLREDTHALLPRIDLVLCKTRQACSIFAELGCRTHLTGFASVDHAGHRGRPALPPTAHYREPRCLHVAGASRMKGTEALLRVWARHPEWPPLTVVLRPALRSGLPAVPNVVWRDDYIDERSFAALMCDHNLHLCPSECEGWGHTLVEAMGCAAAVLGTEAPPMNELLAGDSGLRVATGNPIALRAGWRYPPLEEALEVAIATLLEEDAAERMQRGHAARRRFEAILAEFHRAMGELQSMRNG